MARFVHLLALMVLGAACFAAAILAGSASAKARAENPASSPQVCCLYVIF